MGLDQDDVLQILKMINESKFSELHLEMGDLKIVVRRGGRISIQGLEPRLADPVESEAPESERLAGKGAAKESVEAPEGSRAIRASMVGVFYRAPEPGAAPFVEAGACVREDDTVGLIEVMKLFHAVKSGVRGRIAKICVENAELVEYGQVLFLLEPEGKPAEPSGT